MAFAVKKCRAMQGSTRRPSRLTRTIGLWHEAPINMQTPTLGADDEILDAGAFGIALADAVRGDNRASTTRLRAETCSGFARPHPALHREPRAAAPRQKSERVAVPRHQPPQKLAPAHSRKQKSQQTLTC